jgi:putative drug exporter of the RND superfamily
VGVGVTELALTALTGVVSESSTTSILAIMIGLAVGIDYSLLIMNRYRQGLASGLAPQTAAARAAATSGSAVCFAGLTVLIALAVLAVISISFLTIMGLAAAGAVVEAVAVSITLVPALLGLAGTRLVTARRARRQLAAAAAPGFRPLSRRYVSAVTRAPLAVVAAGFVLLLLAAYPATHIRLGLPDAGSQPTSQTTRQAYDLISEGFGPGANGPLLVVAYAPHQLTPAQEAGARTYYSRAFAGLPDIASIGAPVANPAKDLVLASVIPKTGPSDPQTAHLITLIRQIAAQGEKQYGLQTYVTGQTAVNIDVSARLSAALPVYLLHPGRRRGARGGRGHRIRWLPVRLLLISPGSTRNAVRVPRPPVASGRRRGRHSGLGSGISSMGRRGGDCEHGTRECPWKRPRVTHAALPAWGPSPKLTLRRRQHAGLRPDHGGVVSSSRLRARR